MYIQNKLFEVKLKFLAGMVIFFILFSCNPDDVPNSEETNTETSFSDVLNNLQGTWYLDYREDIILSCSGATNEIKSHVISDLSYSNFQFQFTLTPSNSIFVNGGSSSTYFQASDVCTMIGEGGSYESPFFLYKTSNGNILNPYISGTSDEDQLYFYCDVQFQFDDEIYAAGGRINFIDNNNFTIEVSNTNQETSLLHFTKSNANNVINSEIQLLKGTFIANYSEQYYSNMLSETSSLFPSSLVITDSILSPVFAIDPNSGNPDFYAFRNKFFICHGMAQDWDKMNGMNVSEYYATGSEGSGNWLFQEGQLMMIKNNIITLSKSFWFGDFERLRVMSNTSTELVLRSYQGCNDFIDYHFDRVN